MGWVRFLDAVIWWTGMCAWIIILGAVTAFAAYFVVFWATALVFTLRVNATNKYWRASPFRERLMKNWVFFKWCCREHPTGLDIETENGWVSVYWPGQEPCVTDE